MKPKIFISYAREDVEPVTQLYDKLTAAGFEPWLDMKNLVGGEQWEHAIKKAIRQSDFFLACLSGCSVTKRGFLQKEIREALDLWQEKLDDDIYLIPVRLEECQLPENLCKFHRIDLFDEGGLSLLLKTVRAGAERLNIPLKAEAPSGDITLVTKTLHETKGEIPKYAIEIEYPLIEGLEEKQSEEINVSLLGFLLNRIHRFKGMAINGPGDRSSEYGSELSIYYDVSLLTTQFLSLRFTIYEYYVGAAHGMTYIRTFNYHLHSPSLVDLSELFKTHSDYLGVISEHCVADLRRQTLMRGDEPDALFLDGASPRGDNFKAFNITNHSLMLTFEPYQVDCYAAGTKHVEIPYAAIQNHLNQDGILRSLLGIGNYNS